MLRTTVKNSVADSERNDAITTVRHNSVLILMSCLDCEATLTVLDSERC